MCQTMLLDGDDFGNGESAHAPATRSIGRDDAQPRRLEDQRRSAAVANVPVYRNRLFRRLRNDGQRYSDALPQAQGGTMMAWPR